MSIKEWILHNFKDAQVIGDGAEIRFPCPKCGYVNFYFNCFRKIGFCHKAKCNYSPALKDLIKIIGYSPDDKASSGLFFAPKSKKPEFTEIQWPTHTVKIQYDKKAIKALQVRGIDLKTAEKFDIRTWKSYICIPVYWSKKKKLVNLIRRKINRNKSKKEVWSVPYNERYLYIPGVKTSNYLFNFDYFKNEEELTLVENTFVSISLGVSTNFGSSLSDKQVNLIKNSNVKQILFLWDAGATTEKAIKKLKSIGVKAESFGLKTGQPDDYEKKEVKNLIQEGHKEIRENSFNDWIKRQPLSLRYEYL